MKKCTLLLSALTVALVHPPIFLIGQPMQGKNDQCQEFAQILGGKMLPMDITGGVCTVAKPRPVNISIDGIPTKSPLVSAALFSYELRPDGTSLNLGETGTLPSEIQRFRDNLTDEGIEITAIHTHWLGTDVDGKPTEIMYIHWLDKTMSPQEFAEASIRAWEDAFGKEPKAAAARALAPRRLQSRERACPECELQRRPLRRAPLSRARQITEVY